MFVFFISLELITIKNQNLLYDVLFENIFYAQRKVSQAELDAGTCPQKKTTPLPTFMSFLVEIQRILSYSSSSSNIVSNNVANSEVNFHWCGFFFLNVSVVDKYVSLQKG